VAPTYGDVAARLVAGEGIASWHGWAAVNKFALDAGKDTIKTMLPAEGGYTFCDSWAVPPTVDNVEAVYGWINQTLTPEVNAQAAIGLVGGVTVADAVPLLDEVTASLYPYDDLDSFFEIAPLYNAPPSSSDQYVTVERFLEAWQELKAGS
jgi:spermidine/putrescine-binding protein